MPRCRHKMDTGRLCKKDAKDGCEYCTIHASMHDADAVSLPLPPIEIANAIVGESEVTPMSDTEDHVEGGCMQQEKKPTTTASVDTVDTFRSMMQEQSLLNAVLTQEVNSLKSQMQEQTRVAHEVVATLRSQLGALMEQIQCLSLNAPSAPPVEKKGTTDGAVMRRAHALYYHEFKARPNVMNEIRTRMASSGLVPDATADIHWGTVKQVASEQFLRLSNEDKEPYIAKARHMLMSGLPMNDKTAKVVLAIYT